ncbi:MAG: spermine synthase, partial [Anaerolineae bacterium]
WIPLLLGLLALLWGRGTIKNTPGQIFERESAYNYIQVLEVDGFRYLRLNEGQGVHSVYHPWQLQYNGPWMQVLAAPFFNPAPYAPEQVRSMAIVGLAAGTTARQATAVFGDIPIDGFEIDPAIIQVGEQFFGMNLPNLRPIPQDGRWGLEHSPRRYSIISVDAYRPPYIPWHLTTRQFFQSVYEHLEADGVLVINVGRAPNDRRLIEGLAATIGTVFPSLYVMDVPDTFNSILYATRQPTQVENFYANYQALQMRADVHPLLLAAVTRAVASLHANPCAGDHPAAGCVVFTDDRAPIEWITNDMVLRYVLAGGVEDLQ